MSDDPHDNITRVPYTQSLGDLDKRANDIIRQRGPRVIHEVSDEEIDKYVQKYAPLVDNDEGPGGAIIIAYMAFGFIGMLVGMLLGAWLL